MEIHSETHRSSNQHTKCVAYAQISQGNTHAHVGSIETNRQHETHI